MRSFPLCLVALAFLAPLPDALQKGLKTRRTKEAIVKSNAPKKVAEAAGRRIDRFCAVLEDFFDDLRLDAKSDNKVVARLFGTYEEFAEHWHRNHGDDEPPLAYFSPAENALVMYDDPTDVSLRQVLFHETSHQFMNRYAPEAPKWIDEGLAEYFEGWRMTPEGDLVEKRPNLYDLQVLQRALRGRKHLPLEELVFMYPQTFDEYRENYPELHPYLHYATSWGLVWYGLEGGDRKVRKRFVEYLEDLTKTGAGARLDIDDWEEFEEGWRTAILAMELEPQDAVDHLLLAAGHRGEGEFEAALPLYERAVELDPMIPGGCLGLGVCAKRLGQYEKALEWLGKARLVEPDNPTVIYQTARIVLGIDREGAPSDPARALELVEEALALSPENAQYLVLKARALYAAGDKRGARSLVGSLMRKTKDKDLRAWYDDLRSSFR